MPRPHKKELLEFAEEEEMEPTEAIKSLAAQLATTDTRRYSSEALMAPASPVEGQNSPLSLLSQVMMPAIIEALQNLGGQDMGKSRRLFFQVFSTSVAALLGLSQDTESGMNIFQDWDRQTLFEQQLTALWNVYHTGGTAQADYKLKMLLTHYEQDLRHCHAMELLCMGYQLQGSLYRDMMRYDDAHVFYQQAFEADKELDDVELMSAALARRGVTLIQQNKATAAIAYLHEAFGLMRSQLRLSGAFGAG